MTVELFSDWMKTFNKIGKADPAHKVILIADHHVSHILNLKAIQMAREARIIMVSLPNDATHRMQSLNIAFFRRLWFNYSQEADK
jgi:hypothetical protein